MIPSPDGFLPIVNLRVGELFHSKTEPFFEEGKVDATLLVKVSRTALSLACTITHSLLYRRRIVIKGIGYVHLSSRQDV